MRSRRRGASRPWAMRRWSSRSSPSFRRMRPFPTRRSMPWRSPAAIVADLPPGLACWLEQGTIDAVRHYSERSAQAFCRLVGEAGLAQLEAGLRHHCIAAPAATALGAIGPQRILVARRPNDVDLL